MVSYPAFMLLARADALDAAAAAAAGGQLQAEPLLAVHNNAGVSDAHDTSGGGSTPAQPLNFWSPRSAFWLRVHGYAMLALSVVLIVLGTSAYVYETWLS